MAKQHKSRSNDTSRLMQSYDFHQGQYTDCTTRVEELIRTLLKRDNVTVHSVNSRVKTRDSYEGKIAEVPGKYTDITQVTDVSAARIITYFHDEIDAVAAIIEREFNIDWDNSVDKRKVLQPDTFGYLSLHYIASFSPDRLKLPEYSQYASIKFEIQIRTVLQHAWAEIEHDHGYEPKSKVSLPPDIRRRFSRLAGLLEIGDSEFAQIRDAIKEYKEKATEAINNDSETVAIDAVTLELFLDESTLLKETDRDTAEKLNLTIRKRMTGISYLLKLVLFAGYKNISELEAELRNNKDQILRYTAALKRYREEEYGQAATSLGEGSSCLYSAYIRLYKTQGEAGILKFFEGEMVAEPEKVVRRIINASTDTLGKTV